ncbi:hypothetical protein Tco_0422107 [Tanacetum coccineum]
MDQNSSLGRFCLREDNQLSLTDEIESTGESRVQCVAKITTWKRKIKEFTYYRMEQKKKLKELAARLCVKIKDRKGRKVVKRELLVILQGEDYIVKFIINPNKENLVPGIVLGRSFLKLTRGIVDFGKGIMTPHTDSDPFHDDSDDSGCSKDDWDDIIDGIDFGDIPNFEELELPPFVCNMGKNSRNKGKALEKSKIRYNKEGSSSNIKFKPTEEATRKKLEKTFLKESQSYKNQDL